MEKTLKNINILLTRTRNQSVDTFKKFEELGANVLSFPTIQILTINSSRLDNEIKKLNEYNTLIFTSENAVRSLLKKIKDLNIDFDPEAFFVISIGEKTSQVCKHFGFRVDLQSNIATSGNLTKELSYMDLVGRRILIPSSNLSNPKQFDPLEDQGAVINSLPVYENKVNDRKNLEAELKRLENMEIDLYIFTSPSTFNGFLEILDIQDPKKYFEKKHIAVIGPVTERAIINYGVNPTIMPQVFSMNNLIEEIKKFYTGKIEHSSKELSS